MARFLATDRRAHPAPAPRVRWGAGTWVVLLVTLAGRLAMAEPMYWGQTGYASDTVFEGSFGTASNWFEDSKGSRAASVAPDSPEADLVFNADPANGVGGQVVVDANVAARSLTFETSGSITLAQDANRSLLLGEGGITLRPGAGDVTVGGRVDALSVRLSASQTWANHSSSTLTVRTVTSHRGAGPGTLTLNAAGSGRINVPLSVSDTMDDPLSVVVDSRGSGSVTLAAVSTTGDTIVKAGHLVVTGSFRPGEVFLGGSSGAEDATLTVSAAEFSGNVTVRAGGGRKTLVSASAAGVMSGAMALEDTLILKVTGKQATLQGIVSGTGSLVKEGKGTLVLDGAVKVSGEIAIAEGSLVVGEGSGVTFTMGAGEPGGRIAGSGEATGIFNGRFVFDVSADALVEGASWQVVAGPRTTYGPQFSVTGFTRDGDTWTHSSGLSFSPSTGILAFRSR